MKKMLDETILEFEKDNDDIELLLTKINFLQHERLVHLLVTIFTGIISIMLFICFIVINNLLICLLFFILMIMFIFYIFHYYYLENGIQKLYEIYYKLYKKD